MVVLSEFWNCFLKTLFGQKVVEQKMSQVDVKQKFMLCPQINKNCYKINQFVLSQQAPIPAPINF